MKKLSSLGVVAAGALAAGLAVLGPVAPAQAYPETSIDVTVSSSVVHSGESFTVTAKSDNTTCSWTLRWDKAVRTGTSSTGSPFTTSFTAPQVKKQQKIPLHATCQYDDPGSNVRGSQTWQRTIVITVLGSDTSVAPPKSHSGSGGSAGAAGPGGSLLPNTGGPRLLIALGGLVLLVSGATAVSVSRRRAAAAEDPRA